MTDSSVSTPRLFPAFLNLADKVALLVGGGNVAAQKLSLLLPCGPRVRLVAPTLSEATRRWLSTHPEQIAHWARSVEAADFTGVALVIAAADDPSVNAWTVSQARQRGILANAVDDPPYCDFFTASVVDRGPVRVAISTDGRFPGFSAALRKTLVALLPDPHTPDIERLFWLRAAFRERFSNAATRGAILKDVCADLEARYFGLTPCLQETPAP